MTHQCEICKEYRIDITKGYGAYSSFASHLKCKHNINTKAYKDMGYAIPIELIEANREYNRNKAKNERRNPILIERKNKRLLLEIGEVEYNRYPKCGICGVVAKQLFKHTSNIHNLTTSEYESKCPNSPLALPEYYEYLSNSRKGEHNPMFGNGSSECSPFAKEFYMKKGFDEETSIQMASDKQKSVFDSKTDASFTTKPEYYMKKYNVDRAKALKMLTDRQTTKSVDKIASRYGVSIEEAQIIRDEITRKWQNALSSKTDGELAEINRKKMIHSSVSKVSIDLFNHLIKYCELDANEVKYGENNEEILVSREKRVGSTQDYTVYMFDFCYGKKVIEFNGDLFHANPTLYKADDSPLQFLSRIDDTRSDWTAQQYWDYDADKVRISKMHGYEIHVVWESEWKQDKEIVLKRCKEFLLG